MGQWDITAAVKFMKTTNKLRYALSLLLIAVAGVFIVSCKGKKNEVSVISNDILVGTWRYDETGDGYKGQIKYIFKEDGSGFWSLYYAYDNGNTESEVNGFKYYISQYDESSKRGTFVINYTKKELGSLTRNFELDGNNMIIRGEVYYKTK